MVTGPFTVGSVGAHCAAASTVWMPSTQSIVRTLCQLLKLFRGKCYEKPDNIKASMYIRSHGGPLLVTTLVQSQI